MMNTSNILSTLLGIGQSLWLKNMTREQLQSGSLVRYLKKGWITGATIGPRACSHAIRNTSLYDEEIREKLTKGLFGESLAQELILEDARHAADLLRPVYDRTDGVDGWVALTIYPPSSRDPADLAAAITSLHTRTGRPNIVITLPGLPEWMGAIEEAIYSGMPVNIAFLFSREQYLNAAQVYLRGIERRIAAGLKPVVTSFISISIGCLIAAISTDLPQQAVLQIGTAVARSVYTSSKTLHNSREWERAYNAGARPLRLVWTMDTNNCDDYTKPLLKSVVEPFTVVAIPEHTLKTIAKFGFLESPVPADDGESRKMLAHHELNNDFKHFAIKLQHAEAASMMSSWIGLFDAVSWKSAIVTEC